MNTVAVRASMNLTRRGASFRSPLELALWRKKEVAGWIRARSYSAPRYLGVERQVKRVLYPDHVPTSQLQKVFLMSLSAVTALWDPERADMVATLGEVTGIQALRNIHRRMYEDPIGKRILMDKPRVRRSQLDLKKLSEYPEGSFGKAYATFMYSHSFDPDERSIVKFVDDEELAYVMQRYRECHDYWHVLTGLPPTVVGELALKWFEMVQTELPMCTLSAFVGPLRLSSEERWDLTTKYIPWAARVAPRSRFLMNVYFEQLFEQPLDTLRQDLGIEKAP